jgi:hypothetical protein
VRAIFATICSSCIARNASASREIIACVRVRNSDYYARTIGLICAFHLEETAQNLLPVKYKQ